MDPATLGRAAVTFALLVCALGFVTWRQSRALEINRALEEVRADVSNARADRVELEREIQRLRSRSRVVEAARELGLHTPDATEQFILSKDGTW